MFAEGIAEGGAGFDIFDDVHEGVFESAGLHLPFEDFEAAEYGQAGILERGELAGEGAESLAGDATNGEGFLFASFGAGFFAFLFLLGDFCQFGDKVAHLADFLLGFLFGACLDGVFHLAARGVHRLVFVGWHGLESPVWSSLKSMPFSLLGGIGAMFCLAPWWF